MIKAFDEMAGPVTWQVAHILPKVLKAGDQGGSLTAGGAKLLDPTGALAPGIPLCPPEGDAGTGMVATNSVAPRTGNVSAGTSVFAMIVLDKALAAVHPEIDMVTTPTGAPVAMVHCNNCTGDLDAWAALFKEAIIATGGTVSKAALYDALYHAALEGDSDCGGLVSYNYFSGEHITAMDTGRPLFIRAPDARFTLANFARTLVFSAMATLKLGMDILTEKEGVTVEKLLGHGGLFKTKGVAQRLMAAALGVPIAVMAGAGEGGAWGIALLAAYMCDKAGEPLENFLADKVFAENASTVVKPDSGDIAGFTAFMKRYVTGLPIERASVDNLPYLQLF
jgi:sugar (pentulose or hexulose) kinase